MEITDVVGGSKAPARHAPEIPTNKDFRPLFFFSHYWAA